jgi:hemoglobin
MMTEEQQTLYERVGGKQAIAELIHEFYNRVIADPELKPFFKNTSMDKLRRMQREFFSAALDGPITYTGKPLGYVHHGRGITKHHFALYVGHLIHTLQGRDFNDQDVQDIISRINTYVDEITGDAGSLG